MVPRLTLCDSLPPSAVYSSKHLQGEDPTLEVSHHELHMVEKSKDSRAYKQILEQMSQSLLAIENEPSAQLSYKTTFVPELVKASGYPVSAHLCWVSTGSHAPITQACITYAYLPTGVAVERPLTFCVASHEPIQIFNLVIVWLVIWLRSWKRHLSLLPNSFKEINV